MTVATDTNRKTFAGNGVTTSFATTPIVFFTSSDLIVTVTNDTTGVATTLTENTHYSVSGGATPAAVGTVSLAGGSSPYGAPAAGVTLTILRDVALTQEADFVQNDGSDAEVSEAAHDRVTMIAQRLRDRLDRTLHLPDGDVDGLTVELPSSVDRASSVLGFDADGSVTTYDPASAVTSAANVTTTQSGTGAVSRTAQSKLRDEINIKDFGAVCDGVTDDTAAWVAAEAARPTGSKLIIDGTVKITGAVTPSKAGSWEMRGATINSTAGQIVVSTSNFTLEGGQSAFNFTPGAAASSLDRAVRCTGAITSDSPGYGVTGAVAVGATSFTADDSAEAATLVAGDWIIFVNHDVSNWIRVEHKQVRSVSGDTVNVTEPFKQAFDGTYTIEYVRVSTVRENVKIKNLRITISDTSQDNLGMDFQPGVVNSELTGCTFNIAKGRAWSVYGDANMVVENNDVLRQQGRQSAWSSNTGGRIAFNKFREGVALSTAGGITMETGSFGALVIGNQFFGSNGGSAGSIYANNINGCTFDDNIFVGNGSNIGLLLFGSSDNKLGPGNLFINTTEGITIQKDTAPTPDLNSDRNVIVWPGFKNCTTAVSIKDSNCNNNVVLVAPDSTVTTAISDAGTGTQALRRDGSVGALRFLGGVHVGNAAIANANVLDWYEEGAVTPGVTFGTAGDLAVTYSTQTGTYTRIGNRVFFQLSILTSAFTYTTSSGNFLITGLPYAPLNSVGAAAGVIYGWTKANYGSACAVYSASDSRMPVKLMGTAQADTTVTTTEVASGSTIRIRLSGHYDV